MSDDFMPCGEFEELRRWLHNRAVSPSRSDEITTEHSRPATSNPDLRLTNAARQLLILEVDDTRTNHTTNNLTNTIRNHLTEIEAALAKTFVHILWIHNDEKSAVRTNAITNKQSNNEVVHIQADGLRKHLGFQYASVVLDCRKGWLPNDMLASAGLVKAGGLLVLICPPPSKWTRYFAEHTRLRFSYADRHQISHFSDLLLKHFYNDPTIAWWTSEKRVLPVVDMNEYVNGKSKSRTDGDSSNVLGDISNQHSKKSLNESSVGESSVGESLASELSEEQTSIYRSVFSRIEEADKSYHLITGGRGRGKTTLLAHIGATASLLCNAANAGASANANAKKDATATLTASTNKHLEQAYDEVFVCAPTLMQAQHLKKLIQKHSAKNLTISSLAPERIDLLSNKALLLIDEAAAIAPQLLDDLTQKAAHSVLCTTIEGYEGSGKGLLYRWLPRALEHKYQYTLHRAFRWQDGDPLEKLMQQIYQPTVSAFVNTQQNKFTLQPLRKSDIAEQSHLFEQCHALLNSAHYQNTPNDLMRILDAADHMLWIYISNSGTKNTVVGLICAVEEGGECFEPDSCIGQAKGKGTTTSIDTNVSTSMDGFVDSCADSSINDSDDDSLQHAIARGQRRVQGHMTSQAMALLLNEPDYLREHIVRIQRIAVHPQMQGKGHGSAMLMQFRKILEGNKYNNIATSYGLTASLSNFWQKNGYHLVKIGQRIDTSSGTLSGLLFHTTSPAFLEHQTQAAFYLSIDIYYLKAYHPRLYRLIPQTLIATTPKATKEYLEDEWHLIRKKLRLFVDDKLAFSLVRALLFTVSDTFKLDTTTAIIKTLHQKHIHKAQKLNLIQRLKDECDILLRTKA
ncbi:GNAT family N-acetyltransferase [Glaciecola siphonariae]|uniref:GNAT family N-acetyltransferase n=1 Tax=Glaciecola siphonariae TaxID=521012 RepID=A0ABV9LUJ4_9ALTE